MRANPVPRTSILRLSQSVSDTSPKAIDREGLAESRAGTTCRKVRNGALISQWLQWAKQTSPVFLQKTFGTVIDLQSDETKVTEMYSTCTSQGVH